MAQPKSNNVGLGDYAKIAEMFSALQQQINASRVPNAVALEQQTSDAVASLLDPNAQYVDVNRRAAESGVGRGIAGSAASEGAWLRMTDDERLKRLALGQDILNQAYTRNPITLPNLSDFYITPAQQLQANTSYNAATFGKTAAPTRTQYPTLAGLSYAGNGRYVPSITKGYMMGPF